MSLFFTREEFEKTLKELDQDAERISELRKRLGFREMLEKDAEADTRKGNS